MMKRVFSALILTVLLGGVVFAKELYNLSQTDDSNVGTSIGMNEGIAPSSVNDRYRALLGALARHVSDNSGGRIKAYGTGNAIRLTPAAAVPAALFDGYTISFQATQDNTGSATIQVGTLSAVNLLKNHDTALAAGDIEQDQVVLVSYSVSDNAFQMLSPIANAGSAGTVTSIEISNGIAGGTITSTGTLAVAITPNTSGLEFDSRKLRIDAGTGVVLNASGINLDINGLSTLSGSTDTANDKIAIYDNSATALKKITLANLGLGAYAASITHFDMAVRTTLDLTGFAPSSYENYEIWLTNLAPGTDNQFLQMVTSTDGGSSYDTSGYEWNTMHIDHTSYTGTFSNSDSDLDIVSDRGIGNAAGELVNLKIIVYNPEDAVASSFAWFGTVADPSTNIYTIYGSGTNEAAADVNAVRFRWSAGDFQAVGSYQFIGIKD
jgi:hypothetical protein